MAKIRATASVLLSCLLGCATGRDVVVNTAPSPAPAPSREETRRPNLVMREGGWEIPALDGSRVAQRRETKLAAREAKVLVTRYAPPVQVERRLIGSLFSPEERRALRLLDGQIAVGDIWGYETEGRKFSYILRVNLVGTGANTLLRFCDEDGDGRLETAEASTGFTPCTPVWVR